MTEQAKARPTPAPLLVDAKAAARLCGVSRAHFWAMHSAGKVPLPVRLGRRTLWRTAELADWTAAGCPAAQPMESMKSAVVMGVVLVVLIAMFQYIAYGIPVNSARDHPCAYALQGPGGVLILRVMLGLSRRRWRGYIRAAAILLGLCLLSLTSFDCPAWGTPARKGRQARRRGPGRRGKRRDAASTLGATAIARGPGAPHHIRRFR